jgi:hypothetical protein
MKLGTGNIQLMLESKTSAHSKLLTVKQRVEQSNGGPVGFQSVLMSSLIYVYTTPRKKHVFSTVMSGSCQCPSLSSRTE